MGVPIEFAQWSGLFVPSNTPDAIVNKLREAAKLAANDEKVKEIIGNSGSPVMYLDAPEFKTYWDKDAGELAISVKKIGKVE
jgi:tripartite-type tricarboxylate transporter receptor subunit TctC